MQCHGQNGASPFVVEVSLFVDLEELQLRAAGTRDVRSRTIEKRTPSAVKGSRPMGGGAAQLDRTRPCLVENGGSLLSLCTPTGASAGPQRRPGFQLHRMKQAAGVQKVRGPALLTSIIQHGKLSL